MRVLNLAAFIVSALSLTAGAAQAAGPRVAVIAISDPGSQKLADDTVGAYAKALKVRVAREDARRRPTVVEVPTSAVSCELDDPRCVQRLMRAQELEAVLVVQMEEAGNEPKGGSLTATGWCLRDLLCAGFDGKRREVSRLGSPEALREAERYTTSFVDEVIADGRASSLYRDTLEVEARSVGGKGREGIRFYREKGTLFYRVIGKQSVEYKKDEVVVRALSGSAAASRGGLVLESCLSGDAACMEFWPKGKQGPKLVVQFLDARDRNLFVRDVRALSEGR